MFKIYILITLGTPCPSVYPTTQVTIAGRPERCIQLVSGGTYNEGHQSSVSLVTVDDKIGGLVYSWSHQSNKLAAVNHLTICHYQVLKREQTRRTITNDFRFLLQSWWSYSTQTTHFCISIWRACNHTIFKTRSINHIKILLGKD